MRKKLYSGNYSQEEKKTCDECQAEIGDYIDYMGIIRCVGCWIEFDIDDGIYAVPRPQNIPRVKVRALWDYCKEKGEGIEPKDLTPEELEKFLDYRG